MSQFRFLKYDLYRYFYPNNQISERSLIEKVTIILLTKGIWAIAVYRFRRWSTYELKLPVLAKLFRMIGGFLNLAIEISTGIHIGPEIDIGPGFYIGHFGCIFLGEETRIGKFFNISNECTVGLAGRGENWGLPVIGDFVFMAAGAKAIGKIRIGNHVAIGTNAVVTKDLPDNAVAVGIPAKIISYAGSKDFVLFNEEKNKDIL